MAWKWSWDYVDGGWLREGTAPTPEETRLEDRALAEELAQLSDQIHDLEGQKGRAERRRDALLHYRETRDTLPPLFGKPPSLDGNG